MKIFKKLTIVLIVSFLFLAHNIAFVCCYKTKNLSKIDINWCLCLSFLTLQLILLFFYWI